MAPTRHPHAFWPATATGNNATRNSHVNAARISLWSIIRRHTPPPQSARLRHPTVKSLAPTNRTDSDVLHTRLLGLTAVSYFRLLGHPVVIDYGLGRRSIRLPADAHLRHLRLGLAATQVPPSADATGSPPARRPHLQVLKVVHVTS